MWRFPSCAPRDKEKRYNLLFFPKSMSPSSSATDVVATKQLVKGTSRKSATCEFMLMANKTDQFYFESESVLARAASGRASLIMRG